MSQNAISPLTLLTTATIMAMMLQQLIKIDDVLVVTIDNKVVIGIEFNKTGP